MPMDFSSALQGLKRNHYLRRHSWPEGEYVRLIYLEDGVKQFKYIFNNGSFEASWQPPDIDILAIDWELL